MRRTPKDIIKSAVDIDGLDDYAAAAQVAKVHDRALAILRTAAEEDVTPLEVAGRLARDRLGPTARPTPTR